jgi:peptidoglycan/LPS O-acetylase OafA/YrhL
VQLFFVASAVTLMMSWSREREKHGSPSVTGFFARRFFRIAPSYYLAALVYYVVAPPAGGVDLGQLATSFAFINSWYPSWTPSTGTDWMVVPGGWSVGVEFTFYALFPLIASVVTTAARAVILIAVAVVAGSLCNDAAVPPLLTHFDTPSVLHFIYFWFPNQFVVFAIGTAIFFPIAHLHTRAGEATRLTLSRWSTPLALLAALAFFSLSYLPLSESLSFHTLMPTRFMVGALIMAAFVLMLSTVEESLLVNRVVALVGKVSFSAYLWHFAVLWLLPGAFPLVFHTQATGVAAIAAFAISWFLLCPIVVLISYGTYRLIENPMIRLGQRLLARGTASATPPADVPAGMNDDAPAASRPGLARSATARP